MLCADQFQARQLFGEDLPVAWAEVGQGQAKFIGTLTHHGNGGFDGNGIGFQVEQAIEVEVAVVDFAGGGKVAREGEGGHLAPWAGDDVGYDGYDASSSQGHLPKGGEVVAGEQGDFVATQAADLRGDDHAGGGILDGDDVVQFGEAGDRFGQQVDSAASGDVVEDDGNANAIQLTVVLVEAFLAGLVVVWRYGEGGVGTILEGVFGQADGFGGGG